ncbi:MAG: NADH-quinone oxidoreductase subunit J [Puniceicoccales bacterium]|jgi:NADH:ubiquinone oxidoreductase subunit 6 (subunit J)|nr:NADH-quinone oxidoreductase subunit J [Puniceicoccales bacterium]
MTPTVISLILIAVVTLGTAAVALFLKNIIHCAILLVVAWAGIAAFYLWAGAEFVAFAQVLVYVGAVSMIVLFAVLLTRPRSDATPPAAGTVAVRRTAAHLWGKLTAALVATVLVAAVVTTPFAAPATDAEPVFAVKQIGLALMGEHVGALLIVGVLLTVALLGAVVIAAPENKE